MKLGIKTYNTWYILTFLVVLLAIPGFLWLNNSIVAMKASPYIVNAEDVGHRNVGMVLGTSRYTTNGYENLFFRYRIETAAALYNAGKVDYLILSGDNHVQYYNEPVEMKKALIERGVPEDAIALDFAGFRTFDSVVRCKQFFDDKNYTFTIISQRFHLERALYIAENVGLDAVGVPSKDVPYYYSFKTDIREYFARVKAFLDVHILETRPRFEGQTAEISFQ
jgi:SanA protein